MSDINIQNAIKLVKVKFPQFSVSSSDSLQESNINGLTMNLEHNILFSDALPDSFSVNFALKLSDKESDFSADVKMIAFFKTKELMDENFKKSSFVQVNALAIAFPFLRSFITTITANAGYNPIFLPSINFMKK